MATGKSRKVLQFNEFDFRHRKALEILNTRPRNMTELVVNALLHYVCCPDANLELTKDSIRKLVAEALMEMQKDGTLNITQNGASGNSAQVDQDDLAALGGIMGSFRTRE